MSYFQRLISVFAIVSTATLAQAQAPRPREQLSIPVNRVVQNENIVLDSYIPHGTYVQSVQVITVHAGGNFSQVNLLVNRTVEDSKLGSVPELVLTPVRPVYMDGLTNSIQVGFMGSAVVSALVVTYAGAPVPPPNPGVITLSQYVNRVFYGANWIDVGRLVNMYNYAGYHVISVAIEGFSIAGYGQTQLVTNGGVATGYQVVPAFLSNVGFSLPPAAIIGYNLNSIILNLNGTIQVNRVWMQIAR